VKREPTRIQLDQVVVSPDISPSQDLLDWMMTRVGGPSLGSTAMIVAPWEKMRFSDGNARIWVYNPKMKKLEASLYFKGRRDQDIQIPLLSNKQRQEQAGNFTIIRFPEANKKNLTNHSKVRSDYPDLN